MWINGAQAIPIHSVESRIGFEAEPEFTSHRHAIAIYMKAKFGAVPLCLAENVVIFDPTPQKPFRVSGDRLQISGSNTNDWRVHFAIRPNQSVPEQNRIREAKIGEGLLGEPLATHVDGDISCWCFAPIPQNCGQTVGVDSPFNNPISSHRCRHSMGNKIDIPRGYVSSQLLSGISDSDLITCGGSLGSLRGGLDRLLHIDSLLIGSTTQTSGFPKQSGRFERENNCEKSNDKSGCSVHEVMVTIHPIDKRTNHSERDTLSKAAAFFVTLIGLLGFAGLLNLYWTQADKR